MTDKKVSAMFPCQLESTHGCLVSSGPLVQEKPRPCGLAGKSLQAKGFPSPDGLQQCFTDEGGSIN